MTVTMEVSGTQGVTGLGWVHTPLFDHLGCLKQGLLSLPLWRSGSEGGRANPLGPHSPNILDPEAPILYVRFPSYCEKVHHHGGVVSKDRISSPTAKGLHDTGHVSPSSGEYGGVRPPIPIEAPLPRFAGLDFEGGLGLHYDELTASDIREIWGVRMAMRRRPRVLPRVLLSCDWTEPGQVGEAHKLLEVWPAMKPEDALQLLDPAFADTLVRSYAVKCIAGWDDEAIILTLYMALPLAITLTLIGGTPRSTVSPGPET